MGSPQVEKHSLLASAYNFVTPVIFFGFGANSLRKLHQKRHSAAARAWPIFQAT